VERITTETDDGWVLQGEVTEPESPTRAVAVLGHAMLVDRRTMDFPRGLGLGATLRRRGIATVSFDHRGHGKSRPRAEEGGRWSYDDIVRHDVPAMVAFARGRFESTPLFFVGHSLAGHAAMIWSGLEPGQAPDGIVALGANLWTPSLEPSRTARLAKCALLHLFAALSARRGFFDAKRWKAGTSSEPWPYVRQFLTMWWRDRLGSEDGQFDYEAALSKAPGPILSISSEGDWMLARPESAARFARLVSADRITHEVVGPGAGQKAPDHMEMVLDDASKSIWQNVADWILARTHDHEAH